MFIPVVMAGGSGTRLWPLSRKQFPKQFLNLTAPDCSMLQKTLQRLDGLQHGAPIVVANDDHRFLVAEQLRELGAKGSQLILEPFGRNTAPAIAIAALSALAVDPEAKLLVLAADHVIENETAFHDAIGHAAQLADQGRLVTFGIVPDAPETGYGYIRSGQQLDGHGFSVAEFVEKPNKETAQRYLDSGEFYWNSGMFMFKASAFLSELERYQPEVLNVCRNVSESLAVDHDFSRINAGLFEQCPDISVDYAVMEQTELAAMVPLNAGWNDVGSWSALWQIADKDEMGNSLRGDTVAESCRNSLLMSEHRLVAAVGIEDLVVVETKDAVMVAHRDRVQDVKNIVNHLKAGKRSEADANREVYRPWGHYDSIDGGDRYQVKRISVNPGASLSVQMHHHRAEHWIVVSGTAKVICEDKEILLTENQSTYIPVGAKHSLSNPGKIPLEVIEVQSGAYLGEDDIVRFKDLYGRAK